SHRPDPARSGQERLAYAAIQQHRHCRRSVVYHFHHPYGAVIMWHTLEDIANSRLLDAEQFAIYVKENFPHYLDRFNMLHSMEIEPIVQDYRNSMTTEEVEA